MQLHQLKPRTKNKTKKRKGRGKKHGMYSGRGIKGQKARAGGKNQPVIRRFVKRYPKKRGYRFKPLTEKPVVINVSVLEKKFDKGTEINVQTLMEKGIISMKSGKVPPVKILGKGKLNKSFTIKGLEVSKGAKEKIEKAGGKV